MRNGVSEVMSLQQSWTDENTPEMKRRGVLIRNDIPSWLRSYKTQLREAAGLLEADFRVEGRDGTGRKTEIPWVRFFSVAHSPTATEGWYCVYLFDAPGEALYLALAHGATRIVDSEFKPRSDAELHGLVTWAGGLLKDELATMSRITTSINLNGKTRLSVAYAKCVVAAFRYERNSLPTDSEMLADAIAFSALLGKVYEAQDLGRAPETVDPAVAATLSAVERVSNPLRDRTTGQGFGLNAAERKAVELQAMKLATEQLMAQGYQVKDVSATKSFDLLAKNADGKELYVEVKGTTSGPDCILLTTNEVALHQLHYPDNALIIVHGINLDRSAHAPTGSGGSILTFKPWKIDETHLVPLSFRYTVPAQI